MKTFKDDIETAERNLLIFSWVGVFSAVGVIAFAIWGFQREDWRPGT